MLEIVSEIPKAESVDEGLKQAADQIKALAPKCKDSVASAGLTESTHARLFREEAPALRHQFENAQLVAIRKAPKRT